MKIEVCEQMLSAWLKHVKGCQIVQTNWSPSPVFIEAFAENNLDTINGFVEEIKKFAAENNLDIFKQSTIRQMIIQCEIDVIGIKIEDGIIGDLYLIDSAFHENGLNYGDVVARVLKKNSSRRFRRRRRFQKHSREDRFRVPEMRGTFTKHVA